MISRRLALVTGCAGFIGSHLVERLLADGWRVRGVDAFTAYYPRVDKLRNLAAFAGCPGFDLVEADLSADPLEPLLVDRPTVFHLAAQPGVRGSFGNGFTTYVRDNLVATQRLFEAAVSTGCARVVWASSSSVYGDATEYPCREHETPTSPRSPYGMTKRACEDLAEIYRERRLEPVGLRYFTVYGPRQRPDMAIRRICEAAVAADRFTIYGDGSQVRDFTFVADVVDATVRAATASAPPSILNVGGCEAATLAEVVEIVEELTGRPLALDRVPVQRGDVRRTGADTSLARARLGWRPRTTLRDGLSATIAWVAEEKRPPLQAAAR
jgi:UDP-glucuronate 4-epimerase